MSQNRDKYAQEKLKEDTKQHVIVAYFKYFGNLFSMMLILCGLLSLGLFAVYSTDFTLMYVGIVLIAVAFFNAFLEFYQKFKSEELLKGFMVIMEQKWCNRVLIPIP